ncbi:hypothetical protein MERGE_002919 [Pneumocystis wakefieldiae]|uniref:U6 snRNA-associated Sm-like protein LSm1 n=1 Tax=Pneumocystis wakefieldiae TaxID=38082 RepID=A0A899FYM6_9ASCO|nr:hypothetical protein MERGE_002919 [Pneumocystis wakefieldiae]
MVILRDGRKLIGILRSFDQYANLVLQETTERIYVDQVYGDIPRGVFIVRGENVVLLGEMDQNRKSDLNLKKVSAIEAFNKQKIQNDQRRAREKAQCRALYKLGFRHLSFYFCLYGYKYYVVLTNKYNEDISIDGMDRFLFIYSTMFSNRKLDRLCIYESCSACYLRF